MHFRYYLIALFSIISTDQLCAQNVVPTQNYNYVLVNTINRAGTTNESQIGSAYIYYLDKNSTVSYIDGLGRPLQSVEVCISGGIGEYGDNMTKDRVTGFFYDGYGRESKKYLPYSRVPYDGSYEPDYRTKQASYYLSGDLHGVETDATAYSQTVYEPSPLNRVLAQGAPGTAWQPNFSNPYDPNAKTVKYKYELNQASDNVRIFNIDPSTSQISSPGFYGDGLLKRKVTIDENGSTTKEFTDMTGNVILKQVFTDNDVLQTYYVYDVYDLLRAVIQPEGVAAIPMSGTYTPPADFLNNWMFLYRYDERGRMVMKKVPGADSVLMVYDQWDRLVLTQDGNERLNNRWLFTKYDQLNRQIITGEMVDTRPQTNIRIDVMNNTGRYESVNTSATEGYSLNSSFPSSTSFTLTLLSISHYDDYSNLPGWKTSYSFVDEGKPSYYPTSSNSSVKGMLVAKQVRIVGTSTWMRTVLYYDAKYRVIQTIQDNNAGGVDRVSNDLLFTGQPLYTLHTHSSQFYTTPNVIERSYTFHTDYQVNQTSHSINNASVSTVISKKSTNDMGNLFIKRHFTPGGIVLQKLDYAYNIRGWLNGVNTPYSDKNGYDETDLFSFELHYNTTNLAGATAQYNGNIAEQVWKGGYDEYIRGFKYGYDKANRLMTSDYGFQYLNSYNSPVWDFAMKYNENVTMTDANNNVIPGYDRNGNILRLERFHGNWQRVDDLHYDYNDYNTAGAPKTGNRLSRVTDWIYGAPPVGFKDVNSPSGGNDYGYDANGNLTADLNKGIVNIQYNYLNLPMLIDFGTAKGKIEYSYDASGNKLQKTVTDMSVSPNKISITQYAGDYVYTNSYLSGASVPAFTLEYISHEEGRIRPSKIDVNQPLTGSNTKYSYDYFMKDHLGNTRMVLTTEQQTDLYAATQEPANATKENQLFSNLASTMKPKPAGFDTDGNNSQVTKLDGTTTNARIGPAIVLKVMAGDVISIGAKAWYSGSTQSPPTGLDPIANQLLTLLTSGMTAGGATHGGSIAAGDMSSGAGNVLNDFLGNQVYDNSRPKAFLNWMIVDEEFKKVNSTMHMGSVQVPLMNGGDYYKSLTGPASMTVRRNGWLYVYVSNESAQEVYFDDIVITHNRGPVVEANNYYAFGLEIPGLNSKALGFGGNADNRKKYNGIEYTGDLDLDTYDAFYRNLDPQTGRWWQVDPKVDAGYEDMSPYASMYNDPVKVSDPKGDEGEEANGCCGAAALARAGKTWSNTQKIAGTVELVGGGPENPVADVVAAVVEVGGGVMALWQLLGPESPALTPKAIAPPIVKVAPPSAVVAPDNAAVKVQAPTAAASTISATVNAHAQKKQSTGSKKKSGDNHMRQYKNNKRGNRPNPNKRKGADGRRSANKPID